ncbi:Scramblase [Acanthamoeba castellanii str. Neff]|uniref:Phospholipid scramblase n=1 Tax=Acanthamoeba castellanii (strain ATCC 30010 / Neff) TaxID=1257118 RepID=L8H0F2_ACACF|nr:Scramblase [Acanthamoeba castellanii str. Neff]ELR17856.1 Scramblase [Acanthamoeba castellanii str. Neff]
MEMTRDTASASLSHLANYPNLFVGPHSSHSCFAECLNCALVKEYTIHDPVTNAHLFTAEEEANWLGLNCCSHLRSFNMSVRTTDGELCRFERPWHCEGGGCYCCCCGDFFYQVLRVYGGQDSERPGELLGQVEEQYAYCVSPTFKVMRADDSVAFTIVKDQAYTLQMEIYEGSKRRRDEPVGSIAKLRGGDLAKGLHMSAAPLAVNFPPTADSSDRALLLGAAFLLDFVVLQHGLRG